MYYPYKSPWWLKRLLPNLLFRIAVKEKTLFLTFDDGPTPDITDWVLNQLDKYNARATFFCIGRKVVEHTDIYNRLLNAGHSAGNHTHTHPNGWKTSLNIYLEDVEQCAAVVNSRLFRPPYFKFTYRQMKVLERRYKIVLTDVLTGDFDEGKKPEECFRCVEKHAVPGSIILFHDSQKAFPRLKYALPKVLEHFSSVGYKFENIPVI